MKCASKFAVVVIMGFLLPMTASANTKKTNNCVSSTDSYPVLRDKRAPEVMDSKKTPVEKFHSLKCMVEKAVELKLKNENNWRYHFESSVLQYMTRLLNSSDKKIEGLDI